MSTTITTRCLTPKAKPGSYHQSEWLTVGKREDVIWATRSMMYVGENRHSKKTYATFKKVDSTFYTRKQGRLKILNRSPKGGMQDWTTRLESALPAFEPDLALALSEWYPTLDPAENQGIDRFSLMYGSRSHTLNQARDTIRNTEYPLSALFQLERGLTASLTGTLEEFVLKNYGPSRYRKDLVKALGGLEPVGRRNASKLAKLTIAAAPLVPVDWLVKLLQDAAPPRKPYVTWELSADMNIPGFRRLLRTASSKQLRRLFYGKVASVKDIQNLYDIQFQWDRIRMKDPNFRIDQVGATSWTDLHDELTHYYRQMDFINRPIEYHGAYADLARTYKFKETPITIVAPTDTATVQKWGDKQGHCIGSYAGDAASGQTWLYEIQENGATAAHLQMDRTGRIQQLFGKYNARVTPELRASVGKAIKKHFSDAPANRAVDWGF